MKVAIIFTQSTGINMRVTEKHADIVRAALPGAEVRLAEDPAELIAQDFNADILICWVTGGGHFICGEYCKYATNLKWIHGLSAGVEGVTMSPVADIPGLRLTNAKGIHGIPISEHVVGYILSVSRNLDGIRANQKAHVWKRFLPDEAYGKTVGILGMGAIGSEIAKRCKALGMTVLGVKRKVTDIPYADRVLPETEMDAVISASDFVVMVLPYTSETIKIFDSRRIGLMKKSAYFINVGRGATVDTDALTAALREGKIRGAMLDAIDPEPLPGDHPLWDMENVLVSPHMSAETPLYMDRAFNVFQDNVPLFLKGAPLTTEIDLVRKY